MGGLFTQTHMWKKQYPIMKYFQRQCRQNSKLSNRNELEEVYPISTFRKVKCVPISIDVRYFDTQHKETVQIELETIFDYNVISGVLIKLT